LSPDFIYDSLLWEYLKDKVLTTNPRTTGDLKETVLTEIRSVHEENACHSPNFDTLLDKEEEEEEEEEEEDMLI
jgi:hypothetical protein